MKSIEERHRELFKEVQQLREENRILKYMQLNYGELSDDDYSWLQQKVASQRKALDRLNRKVLSQRFRLRVLNEMGRDLTKEEYLAARDALVNEQVKERIEDYAPVA